MKEIKYSIDYPKALTAESFQSASAEELRVLIAVEATGGRVTDVEKLSSIASVSKPRTLAALALWEGEGVITVSDADTPEIINEFEDRLSSFEIAEESSVKVAQDIRNNNLATMIDELSKMLKQPSLPTQEIKRITALYTQYSFTEEYVLTLAAFLQERNTLTVTKLINEAIKLSSKNINTLEELEGYLSESRIDRGNEFEIRRILGIYGKSSKKEKEIFKKWSETFGYGEAIISEAYGLARLRGASSVIPYIDKLLTEWHSKGYKTVKECTAATELHSQELQKEPSGQGGRPKRKSEASTPKYGNFDASDAFKKALDRSYGEEKKKD